MLRQLSREADWNPWCLRSISRTSGIGKIVSPDLEGTFRDILSSSERDQCHQSYVVDDDGHLGRWHAATGAFSGLDEHHLRFDVEVWSPMWRARCVSLRITTQGHLESDVLLTILADVTAGEIDDPVDELLGILLKSLYPQVAAHNRHNAASEAAEGCGPDRRVC